MHVDFSKLVVVAIANPARSGWSPCFTRVQRRFFGERFRWNFRGNRPVVSHAHHTVACDATDFRAGHVPFVKDFTDKIFFSPASDDQHSLLRFAQENFVRGHAGFALGHFGQINLDAASGSAGGFAG